MSIKALREALEELGYHATTDCQSASGAEETQRKFDAAVEELNAIERAAKALSSGQPGVLNDSAIDAWLDLGESIAEGAP